MPKFEGPSSDGLDIPNWLFWRSLQRVEYPLLYRVWMNQFSMSSFCWIPLGPEIRWRPRIIARLTSGGAALSTRMYDHISDSAGPCGCMTRIMRPTAPMLGKI